MSGDIILKNVFVTDPKFKFNWISCIFYLLNLATLHVEHLENIMPMQCILCTLPCPHPQVTFTPPLSSLSTFFLLELLPTSQTPSRLHSLMTQQSSSRAMARRIQQSIWRHFSFCLGCPALGSVLQLKSPLSSRNTPGSV